MVTNDWYIMEMYRYTFKHHNLYMYHTFDSFLIWSYGGTFDPYFVLLNGISCINCHCKMVQVGNDQVMAQSERKPHSKYRGGKKQNRQLGTYTKKTYCKPSAVLQCSHCILLYQYTKVII